MALVTNQHGTEYSETITFYVEHCFKCSVPFAITRESHNRLRDSGETFYCPSGHGQCYRETTEARLRRELARAQQQRDEAQTRASEAREQAKKDVAIVKGKMTKMKNRVAKGVCPCCNRFFSNLHRHMTSEHPDYTKAEV